METPEIRWEERAEQIQVVKQNLKTLGAVMTEGAVVPFVAKHGTLTKPFQTETMLLHRPSLAPIYGGPTLLEALWSEMDRLMEALMTGQTADDSCKIKGYHGVPAAYDDHQANCEHWDNGDRYRAEELAWVIALVTNPYDPSVDRVRAEAMERWNAMQDQEVDPSVGSLGGVPQ